MRKLESFKDVLCTKASALKLALVTAPAVLAVPMVSFASEAGGGFNVETELTTAFQGMATTMLGTISSVLPVVMSIMSAYICIQFGIKFFKRFAK